MKRTRGRKDGIALKRRQAREAVASKPMSQVASLPELRAIVEAILDYLNIEYER